MDLGGEVFEHDGGAGTVGFDFDGFLRGLVFSRRLSVARGVVLVVTEELGDVETAFSSDYACFVSGFTGIEGATEGGGGAVAEDEKGGGSNDGFGFGIAPEDGGDGFQFGRGVEVVDDGSHVIPSGIPEDSHGFEFRVQSDVLRVPNGKLKDGVESAAFADKSVDLLLELEGAGMVGKVGPVHEGDVVLAAGGEDSLGGRKAGEGFLAEDVFAGLCGGD